MKHSTINYFVIVPAAGTGARMQIDMPKQYLSLRGKKIIEYTLTALLSYAKFKRCIVVLNKGDKYWPTLQLHDPRLLTVYGGKERYHSVFNALLALKAFAKKNDWVLVHDAVRPLLHHSDINKLINSLADHPIGGFLVNPVKNTVKYVDDKQILKTLDRNKVWQAITPQMFRYHWLVNALDSVIKKGQFITDEANAIELLGQHAKMVVGRSDNIKITDKDDLTLLDYYLSRQPIELNRSS
ncbi:MAG: 2-C-methyl-D-erythritol 4-phosphate cytidylyltransferase [Pseudomonadota bacterium]|jgi:2-C-methyl-D-erythritol 4-phosphate cytidylyltransferase